MSQSNSYIKEYSLTQLFLFLFTFQLLLSQTTDRYLKVNFMGPENLP